MASWYRHTLNASVTPYLENMEILSSLSIPIKQNVQNNMFFIIQGQWLPGVDNPECLPCDKDCPGGRP